MDFRILRLDGRGRFDALVLVGALALFALNEHAVKPAIEGAPLCADAGLTIVELVIRGYFNDFLGGLAFLAYANLLMAFVRPRCRIRRLSVTLAFIAACGLFWEYVAPLFVPGSVSDPWDVLAYCLGGATYWAAQILWTCAREKSNAIHGDVGGSGHRRRRR